MIHPVEFTARALTCVLASRRQQCEWIRGRAPLSLALADGTWPSPGLSTAYPQGAMADREPSFFHLHLVSDATGETLITVARAAADAKAARTGAERDRGCARDRAVHATGAGIDRTAGNKVP